MCGKLSSSFWEKKGMEAQAEAKFDKEESLWLAYRPKKDRIGELGY